MSRYIDADKVKENFFPAMWDTVAESWWKESRIASLLDKTPRADVAPVVHARWYYHYRLKKFVCLNCGFEQRHKPNFKFCPQCGAIMDEEVRND